MQTPYGKGNELQANVSALGGSYYFNKGIYKVYVLGGMSRRSRIGDQIWDQSASNGFKYDFFTRESKREIYLLDKPICERQTL